MRAASLREPATSLSPRGVSSGLLCRLVISVQTPGLALPDHQESSLAANSKISLLSDPKNVQLKTVRFRKYLVERAKCCFRPLAELLYSFLLYPRRQGCKAGAAAMPFQEFTWRPH